MLSASPRSPINRAWATVTVGTSDATYRQPLFQWSTSAERVDDPHKAKRPFAGRVEALEAGRASMPKAARIWTHGAGRVVQHRRGRSHVENMVWQLAITRRPVVVVCDTPGEVRCGADRCMLEAVLMASAGDVLVVIIVSENGPVRAGGADDQISEHELVGQFAPRLGLPTPSGSERLGALVVAIEHGDVLCARIDEVL